MPSLKEISTWLTPTEAGKEIGISKQGVYKLLEYGHLKRHVRTHAGTLIDPRSVQEYAEQRRERHKAREDRDDG